MWTQWYGWAIRSRLEPVKRVARRIRKHWDGVINAATSDVTSTLTEGLNGQIQAAEDVDRRSCALASRAERSQPNRVA